MIAVLQRQTHSDQGTFGNLTIAPEVWCTGELPWRNNEKGKSCIPAGKYFVRPYHDEKHGDCLRFDDVQSREGILIHAGNTCGDIDKGLISDTEGCILVGKQFGMFNGQKAVLYSKMALKEILSKTPVEGLTLTILEKGENK